MSRKGENIYRRKDGRWEGRIFLQNSENSKTKYKYLYGKTYDDVLKKLIKIQEDNAVQSIESCQDNYNFWLSEWLQAKKFSVKESTYIRYKNIILNHIQPELGKMPLNEIDNMLISEFLINKRKYGRLDNSGGLSEKSVSDILLVLKETFKYIESRGIRTECTFDKFTLRSSQKEMRVLSTYEEHKLIKVLCENMDLYKLGVFICLCTGIRIGELCALKWENISIPDKTLEIKHTLQRLQKDDDFSKIKTRIIINEPKSFAGKRIIPLPDFLTDIIKPFEISGECYFLSGEKDRIIEPRVMQNKFKKYLTESGIKDANFHALRHTFATRCVEVGFDIKSLSEILGHSSVKITLDKYVHSSMEFKRDNMEKLKKITMI